MVSRRRSRKKTKRDLLFETMICSSSNFSSRISTLASNLGPGWINIGEAYLYVPLSIFRKFTPGAMINFKDQTKRRFLENNRHCLLRHMPIEYQKLFFFGRHNLGNLFEQLEKLAFMGLITFENIQKRQKEQRFTDEGPTCLYRG